MNAREFIEGRTDSLKTFLDYIEKRAPGIEYSKDEIWFSIYSAWATMKAHFCSDEQVDKAMHAIIGGWFTPAKDGQDVKHPPFKPWGNPPKDKPDGD